LGRFLQALELRSQEKIRHGQWIAVERPRPCTFTDLAVGDWRFRLVFDPEGLAPAAQASVFPEEPTFEAKEIVTHHRGACLVFLTAQPETPGPPGQLHGSSPEGWSRFRKMADLVWAWLDAGAELLCFPEGRVHLPRRVLLPLEPEQLSPEHAYLFLSNGVADQSVSSGKRLVWVRTWGLAQFGLPDLASKLELSGSPDSMEKVMKSLRLLLETLPPAMIREHGMLGAGGTVQVEEAVWRATGAPQRLPQSFLASRFGVQLFEQAPTAI